MDQNNTKVEFEDSMNSNNKGWSAVRYYKETSDPAIVRFVIKYSGGVVKDAKGASYLLMVLVIIFFSLSTYFFFFANKPHQATPEMIQAEIQRRARP